MGEIAFARELTFRAAGEGTGRSADRDRYDLHYLHLFLWDDEENCLVGGYRIGRTDEIMRAHGVNWHFLGLSQLADSKLFKMGVKTGIFETNVC